MILSPSNKYHVVIENDDNGEKTTYELYNSSNYKTVQEKNKYEIIKIIRTEDNYIIHEYKQLNSSSPLNKFIKINNEEWWFGGRDYMLKLFINCDTGEVYDDPLNREESDSYKCGTEFIWTGPYKISPNGKYMLITGCVWSFPFETKLYDISDLSQGYKEISIDDHLIDQNKELYDSNEFDYEFITDNLIKLYVYIKLEDDSYEKVYYNTIKY